MPKLFYRIFSIIQQTLIYLDSVKILFKNEF